MFTRWWDALGINDAWIRNGLIEVCRNHSLFLEYLNPRQNIYEKYFLYLALIF